jgi:hypothetical protein
MIESLLQLEIIILQFNHYLKTQFELIEIFE